MVLPKVWRRLRPVAPLSLATLGAVAFSCQEGGQGDVERAPAGEAQSAFAAGVGAVHGYVDAQIDPKIAPIALPDVAVRLKRTSDGLLTAPVKTDEKGFFIASNVAAGTYTTCITAPGFASGCSANQTFLVKSGRIANPPHALFSPERVPIYGRVALSDKTDVRYENALFSTSVDTFVRALTPSGATAAGPVRANARGEYVLGALPANASYRVVAKSGSVDVESTVAVTSSPVARNLVLKNRRPVVAEVTALQGAKAVRHVDPGAKVRVEARATDPDGQALHYRWSAPGGGCPTTDAPSVECTLPAALGTHSIFVQVSDGVGQFAVGRVRVSVGPAVSLFSGTLVSDAGNVAGAEVRVNGKAAVSDARGGFTVTVPETNRYVLTVKKDGFQTLSKVFLEEHAGSTYRLLPVDKATIDPTKDNVLVARPPRQEGSTQEGFKGVAVTLKADTIVDASGNKVKTPVDVYYSQFDHLFDRFDRMPGDWGATNAAGRDTTLTSFGAVEVNLRGPAGQKYNIAPGTTAELRYNVHPAQAATAPATIPLWYYNEEKGLWEEDGQAALAGSQYIAQAKHFSAINVDLEKEDATCLKLVVDQTRLTVPFSIRLTVPGSPNIVRDREITDNVSAIVRLPPNVPNVTIDVLDAANNPTPGSHRVFSTGDVVAAGTNLTLAAPYNECITPPSPPVTLSIDLPQDPSPTYLSYIRNDEAYAVDYYNAIGADATLDLWKDRNDFDVSEEADAYYFNAGDLEFGRSMHMRRRADGGIAYYVTNYPNADEALAGDPGEAIATVAMEYSSYPSGVPGAPKFTKFYVYDGAGNLARGAELDNRGEKFVPGLCVVCHGGTLPADIAAAGGNTESRFIPFDLASFGYPAGRDRIAQEEDFRELNEGIYFNTNATDAQKALIDAWYPGGVTVPLSVQQDNNLPFDWNVGTSATDKDLYRKVIRPSCRSCHNSRTTDSGLDWGSKVGFDARGPGINGSVCNGGYMPQAFVTWRNFWHSTGPSQPNTLGSYLAGIGVGTGTCTGP
jgi:hypothetical protein